MKVWTANCMNEKVRLLERKQESEMREGLKRYDLKFEVPSLIGMDCTHTTYKHFVTATALFQTNTMQKLNDCFQNLDLIRKEQLVNEINFKKELDFSMNHTERLTEKIEKQVAQTAKEFKSDLNSKLSILNVTPEKSEFLGLVMDEWPQV